MTDLVLEIQQQYGVELPFVCGSFEEAKREAQRSARYLLVYLHCPTHEDTHAFVTGTLADPRVRDLLESRFVAFAASVMEPAGHRLALELQTTAFPFVALFLRRSTVLRIKGHFAADDLVRHFQSAFDHWDGVLGEEIQLRHEREAKERARHDEERRAKEIESADRERLRLFDEAERARRSRAELQRREAEEARLKLLAEANARAALAAQRAAAAQRLPPEPPADIPDGDVALVCLRRPCGAQERRRFRRADPVEALHDWARTIEEEGCGDFQLVAGYPPRPLPNSGAIGDVPELVPRGVVYIRPV